MRTCLALSSIINNRNNSSSSSSISAMVSLVVSRMPVCFLSCQQQHQQQHQQQKTTKTTTTTIVEQGETLRGCHQLVRMPECFLSPQQELLTFLASRSRMIGWLGRLPPAGSESILASGLSPSSWHPPTPPHQNPPCLPSKLSKSQTPDAKMGQGPKCMQQANMISVGFINTLMLHTKWQSQV